MIIFGAAAWSCSWDFHRSYYIYAGLQNGTLMVFDMRQTVKPVESLNGLSSNPIHTILSFSQKNTNGPRSVLIASSIGLSLWNDDCREERNQLIGFSGWQSDFEIVVEELSFVQNQKSEVALYSESSFLSSISPRAKSSWEAVT
ncbi:uncharacterized protein LOC116207277 isoform X2 [Punica granatum]|uniref:RING-type E3 ubiquitin transferase n=1 Tax=Punica granatum TaxID=22663 RepID=A0A6P8DHN6_PUNGR|nr:uncharacterized protein LOC116207277 isoform X2 [Punica granatum]